MIPVSKIFEQIRIDEMDMDAVKYSDWDLENALNKALRLICNQLSQMNTDFCEKEIDLTEEDLREGYELPKDFLSVWYIVAPNGYKLHPSLRTIKTMQENEYLITQGKLYTKLTEVTLRYKVMLPEVHAGEAIDMPFGFFDMVEAVTRLILNNEPKDKLLEQITMLAKAMVPSRRYAAAWSSMPFRV